VLLLRQCPSQGEMGRDISGSIPSLVTSCLNDSCVGQKQQLSLLVQIMQSYPGPCGPLRSVTVSLTFKIPVPVAVLRIRDPVFFFPWIRDPDPGWIFSGSWIQMVPVPVCFLVRLFKNSCSFNFLIIKQPWNHEEQEKGWFYFSSLLLYTEQ
jgi:hypothetical protein